MEPILTTIDIDNCIHYPSFDDFPNNPTPYALYYSVDEDKFYYWDNIRWYLYVFDIDSDSDDDIDEDGVEYFKGYWQPIKNTLINT